MLCPKCNKKMKIMAYTGSTFKSDLVKYTGVIGRCDDCDFDATWEIRERLNGETYEGNLQRYFFG